MRRAILQGSAAGAAGVATVFAVVAVVLWLAAAKATVRDIQLFPGG